MIKKNVREIKEVYHFEKKVTAANLFARGWSHSQGKSLFKRQSKAHSLGFNQGKCLHCSEKCLYRLVKQRGQSFPSALLTNVVCIGVRKGNIRSCAQGPAQNQQGLEGMQEDRAKKDQELGKISDRSQNSTDIGKVTTLAINNIILYRIIQTLSNCTSTSKTKKTCT